MVISSFFGRFCLNGVPAIGLWNRVASSGIILEKDKNLKRKPPRKIHDGNQCTFNFET
jgi:hypothetical protein